VIGRDIDEACEQQRFAEALAAVRGPRAGGPEPTETAIVTVMRGERAVAAIAEGDVNTRRTMDPERERDLEWPRGPELGPDRLE
jgi:hypothetical protein